jgi:predicted permease
MIGAGLFVGTLQKLEQTGTGFDKDRVVLFQLDSASSNLNGTAMLNLSHRIEARVRTVPGVQATSFSMQTFNEGQWMTPLWPEGVEHTEANGRDFEGNRVGAQYFEVLGTPIVMGRSFGSEDSPQSRRVAVINETLARKLYPEGSPLGHRFALAGRDKQNFEIVGVVKDAKYISVRERPRGMWFVYTEQEQSPDSFNDLVVRVKGKPEAVLTQMRAAIRDEDPKLAIAEATPLAEIVNRSFSQEKLLAKLAGFFGSLALLLAAIGLYGVMSYSVSRRTNEIGIRMALGARPASVLRMVLGEYLIVVALGLAVGIPAALACGRLVSSQLYGLAANDPFTIAAASTALLAVALAAVYVPARRATLLDPLAALRQE